MRTYLEIIAYLRQVVYRDPLANYDMGYKPFVAVYDYYFDGEFKAIFTDRVEGGGIRGAWTCNRDNSEVVFKDDHTVFNVNLCEIRICTDRPKNTINVFLHEIDWIFSECRHAKYLYLPLLRELLKLNHTFK